MLFDSSVRKELARTFGATLVVLLTIMLTNALIRTVGQAASGVVAPQDVVLSQEHLGFAWGTSDATGLPLDALLCTQPREHWIGALKGAGVPCGSVRDLHPISHYNEDYHLFQTTKEEEVMRAVRNGLYGAGIPVECSKGEAEAGQEEVNYRYSDALDTADNHVIVKQGVKEIAHAQGKSVTFMAKYDHRKAGSSSHIHQSLWTKDGKAAFADHDDKHGMSPLMKQYMAGQLAHAGEITGKLFQILRERPDCMFGHVHVSSPRHSGALAYPNRPVM